MTQIKGLLTDGEEIELLQAVRAEAGDEVVPWRR